MSQSKIKVKIVEFVNNLLASKPTQYKPALQTPTVVSAEKFIENIAKETGLSKFQANNVLSCIFQTAGDYMELGNAVQLHEDFGTLKPYLKVKAVNEKESCKYDCIQGMGLRLIPTGKMRDILSKTQFVFTGMSSGSDVEESEVVDPNTPTTNPVLYTLTWKHGDTVKHTEQLAEGASITEPAAPEEGYHWKDVPATMPGHALEIVSEADSNEPPVLS